ncbi:MAG TPA: hypothetical protein VIE90_04905 [Candidatus Binatia bacterium]
MGRAGASSPEATKHSTMRALNLFDVTPPQIRTTGFDLELICAVGYNPRQVKPKCDR